MKISALRAASDSSVLACVRGEGIFSRSPRGEWTSISGDLPTRDTISLAVDPHVPNTIYVITGSGLFKTTNGGTSWIHADAGLPLGQVTVIAINPSVPNALFAGSSNHEPIYATTDAASSWQSSIVRDSVSDVVGRYVWALALSPLDPAAVYVGTYEPPLLFGSFDLGETWSELFQFPMGESPVAGQDTILADPARTGTVYVATNLDIYKSSGDEEAWIALGVPFGPNVPSSLAIDPVSGTIFAGDYGRAIGSRPDGVLRSTDAGETWVPANANLTNRNVLALAFDPRTGILFAGTDGGGVFELATGTAPTPTPRPTVTPGGPGRMDPIVAPQQHSTRQQQPRNIRPAQAVITPPSIH